MFNEDGYIVVRNLIPSLMCQRIQGGIEFLLKNNLLTLGDNQVEKAYGAYCMPFTEMLLQTLCPIVSKLIGAPLYPTYSFLRVYLNGAILPKHTDRESCEITATLTIGAKGTGPWPIFFGEGAGAVGVELGVGDAIIFEGTKLDHWRERFEGEWQTQVFLHFVRQEGDFSSYKFDKRPGLGVPALV